MKVLVDTSLFIDFLRRKDKRESAFYSLVLAKHTLLVSIITHTELFAGKSVWENKDAKKELDKLLTGLKIIPLTENISKLAGKIRAKNEINVIDAIIAATSIENGLPLVTLNTKDFSKIPDIKLFEV